MGIDKQLRKAIQDSGMNLNQLAREIGIPQPTLYRFAHGTRDLYFENAAKIAEYFGMKLTATKRVAPAATSSKLAKPARRPAGKKRPSRTE
jgi:ribosome-binding protein aMBF1 (putative translation factor)